MLHAKYSLQILRDALKYHKKFTNVSTCDLSKSSLSDCIIVGDLHGSFKDLYYLIQKFGTPGKNYRFIFNGDFFQTNIIVFVHFLSFADIAFIC